MQNERSKVTLFGKRSASMSFKKIYSEIYRHFDSHGFRKNVETHCFASLKQFKKIVRSYLFFHLFFFGLLLLEIIVFSFSFSFLCKSVLIAFSIAAIILTIFSYLITFFYFETKKPEQFFELRNRFMHLCEQSLPKDLAAPEYHLFLANSAYRFASHLMCNESHFQSTPFLSRSIRAFLFKVMSFSQNKDFHQMKEILLLVSVSEHVTLIKKKPTNLEAHASLANTYIALAKLYRGDSKEMREKFSKAMEKGIQEFKVLDHYSPNEPWVQAQLASCYHDLKLYREEILCYEKILELCPSDKQILFRLGVLYFQQGVNARGLCIYEKLKGMNFSRAEELINYYEANIRQDDVEQST